MIYTWTVREDGQMVTAGQEKSLVQAHHELISALHAAGPDAEGIFSYGVDRSRTRVRVTLVTGGIRLSDP